MAPRVTIKLATMNATVDSIRINLDDICTEREFSAHFAERQSQPYWPRQRDQAETGAKISPGAR